MSTPAPHTVTDPDLDTLRDTVLATRGMSVHYGTTIALRDVDLTVRAGELLAVVGRNGAGKSSLLSALAGIYPFHGHATWTVAADRIAYVPQRAHPRWEMPLQVRQVVASGCLRGRRWWARPTIEDRRIVTDAIARLGLTELADRPVRTLSGGQAQRVLLARALAQQPSVLLLDEPYDGLDKTHVAILNQVLTDLAGQGVAVVAAVHELAIVHATYQRVLALDGRLLAQGTPTEVFSASGLNLLFGIGSAA